VQLSLRTAPTEQLIQAVADGELDGAFVAGQVQHPRLEGFVAYEEALVLVAPPLLADWRAAPAALVFRTGCTYRKRLEEVLLQAGLAHVPRLELGTLDGILGCVSAGLGLALLPRIVVERAVQPVRLHDVSMPVETWFITRRDGYRGAALREFTAPWSAAASPAAPLRSARKAR
jgi:DNA-binding transcriptional LysR family regulator